MSTAPEVVTAVVPGDPATTDPTVPSTVPSKARIAGIGLFSLAVATAVVLTVLLLVAPLEREQVGLIALALTIGLMLSGVHIAVSMSIPSLLGLWKIGGMSVAMNGLETVPYSSAASWSLTVIPMFVLMGLILYETGLASTVFEAARQIIGRIPGGLAVATIFSGAGMSAASGSTLGVTYAVSRIGIPEMLKAGYSPRLASGTVAMAGVLKLLIPPSITVVIYAGIAGTSVGPQLLAGVVPGIVLALLFAMMIVVRASLVPGLAPAVDTSSFTWRTRTVAVLRAWPVALLALIIIGGMYSGLTTATESGALAALSSILVGAWAYRDRGAKAYFQLLGRALANTVAAVAAIMFLIISVNLLTQMAALSGVVQNVTTFIVDLGLGRTTFLLLLVVVYVVLGMLMDELAMMLLTVPILMPVLQLFDIDLIWFGVFLVLLCEIGMVVPPVGFLAFVVHGIAQRPEVNLGQRITLMDIFRGVFWYVVVALALVIFLIFVPELALWLPNLQQ